MLLPFRISTVFHVVLVISSFLCDTWLELPTVYSVTQSNSVKLSSSPRPVQLLLCLMLSLIVGYYRCYCSPNYARLNVIATPTVLPHCAPARRQTDRTLHLLYLQIDSTQGLTETFENTNAMFPCWLGLCFFLFILFKYFLNFIMISQTEWRNVKNTRTTFHQRWNIIWKARKYSIYLRIKSHCITGHLKLFYPGRNTYFYF